MLSHKEYRRHGIIENTGEENSETCHGSVLTVSYPEILSRGAGEGHSIFDDDSQIRQKNGFDCIYLGK